MVIDISPSDHLQKVHQLPAQTEPCNTLFPLERRGSRSAGYTGGFVPISTPFHFLGIPGRVTSNSMWGKSLKFIFVDGGIQNHDPKTMILPTKPIIRGYY